MKKGGKGKNTKQKKQQSVNFQQDKSQNNQSQSSSEQQLLIQELEKQLPATTSFLSQAKTESEKLALIEQLQKTLENRIQQKKMEAESQLQSHSHTNSDHHNHNHHQQQQNNHNQNNKNNNNKQNNQSHSHNHSNMEVQQEHQQDQLNGYDPENNEFLQDEEEFKHFRHIVCSYFNYRTDSLKDVARMERGFYNIGENRKYLKFDFNQRLDNLKAAIESNAQFLDKVVDNYREMAFAVDPQTKLEYVPQEYVQQRDISKLRSTLKQIIRDWSEEGKAERDLCYKPVFEEFKRIFPNHIGEDGKRVRALFPGCGLGRVVFDFACHGYGAQGNEFSYHMLFASNYLLNMINRAKEFTIQPFIHSFCNTFSEQDPFRKFQIPDINPSDLLDPEVNDDFSMAAGEFVEIYQKQPEEWHGVCTIFFIDTANDIIQYIKTIHKCLKPGGAWINLGPLLYHYAESTNEPSIELSWEELQHIIKEIGFKLTIHPKIKTNYASDPYETMMKIEYNCIFFTAIKI